MRISNTFKVLYLCVLLVTGAAQAQDGNAKLRDLLGQLDKATEFLEVDLRMQGYWDSHKKYVARHNEMVMALRNNRLLTRDAGWKRRMKAALTTMQKEARELTTVKKTSARSAVLMRHLRQVQRQTNTLVGNYLKFMATSSSAEARAITQNHNKLAEYMSAANRERRRLE
jgi:hypothetical protein